MVKSMQSSEYQGLIEKIHYSERYCDDANHEFRHVILPKQMLDYLPKTYFQSDKKTLRLLAEDEWRNMGIVQSLGWEHEVHAPEPNILIFRRDR